GASRTAGTRTDRAIVNAFKPIVQALRASRDVATPPAVEALTEQNEAAQDALSASGVDSDQAVALAGKSAIRWRSAHRPPRFPNLIFLWCLVVFARLRSQPAARGKVK